MSGYNPCRHTGRLQRLAFAFALGGPLATGCDNDEAAPTEHQSNIAKAFAAPGEADEVKRKADEAELAAALAERRAREDAEEATLRAAIAEIAKLPENAKQRSDKKRCDDVADAYDRFTKRRYAEDAKNLMLWYEGRRARRAEIRERCRRMPAKTMDCYERTLDGATEQFYELENRLLKHCIDSHGGSDVLPATVKVEPA